MLILGIETSCDETSCAVVEDGHRILSNIVASQISIHARYGGVVPEVASRQHLLEIVPVLDAALREADVRLNEIDGIAVTNGPGLMGALMVGLNFAKALAFTHAKPFVGIHHIEGHAYAAWLDYEDPATDPGFPLVLLIASGAHTDLILMSGHGQYRMIGRTRDDASGEAFDKTARILGLGYPGGPEIQRVSDGIEPSFRMPRAWLGDSFDFSFSGLKTAVLHKAQSMGVYPPLEYPDYNIGKPVEELAAAFKDSVVDVISAKAVRAINRYGAKGLVVGGGVSANRRLREVCYERSPVPVLIPAPKLCTDIAAMIAAAGFFRLVSGERSGLALDAYPSLGLTG